MYFKLSKRFWEDIESKINWIVIYVHDSARSRFCSPMVTSIVEASLVYSSIKILHLTATKFAILLSFNFRYMAICYCLLARQFNWGKDLSVHTRLTYLLITSYFYFSGFSQWITNFIYWYRWIVHHHVVTFDHNFPLFLASSVTLNRSHSQYSTLLHPSLIRRYRRGWSGSDWAFISFLI